MAVRAPSADTDAQTILSSALGAGESIDSGVLDLAAQPRRRIPGRRLDRGLDRRAVPVLRRRQASPARLRGQGDRRGGRDRLRLRGRHHAHRGRRVRQLRRAGLRARPGNVRPPPVLLRAVLPAPGPAGGGEFPGPVRDRSGGVGDRPDQRGDGGSGRHRGRSRLRHRRRRQARPGSGLGHRAGRSGESGRHRRPRTARELGDEGDDRRLRRGRRQHPAQVHPERRHRRPDERAGCDDLAYGLDRDRRSGRGSGHRGPRGRPADRGAAAAVPDRGRGTAGPWRHRRRRQCCAGEAGQLVRQRRAVARARTRRTPTSTALRMQRPPTRSTPAPTCSAADPQFGIRRSGCPGSTSRLPRR